MVYKIKVMEKIFCPNNIYGVLGHPLNQSLSPLIHNTAFRYYEMDSVYLSFDIESSNLKDFAKIVRILPVYGLSITIPHKIAIMDHLDVISDNALQVGAVNTLYWNNSKLCGENTDITGFLSALENEDLSSHTALILGSGGAAHAICAALSRCKEVFIATISNKNHKILAKKFGLTAISWEQRQDIDPTLIVNTTPLGMHGKFECQSPYDFKCLSKKQDMRRIAYDIVYNPLKTLFIEQAENNGLETITGLPMFYGQADRQFELWTNKHLPENSYKQLFSALA